MIGNIVGAFVVIVVGITMFPNISNEIKDVEVTGAASTILSFLPTMMLVLVIIISLTIALSSIKSLPLNDNLVKVRVNKVINNFDSPNNFVSNTEIPITAPIEHIKLGEEYFSRSKYD